METSRDASEELREGLELAHYVLPEARRSLRPDGALAARVTADYARALRRHQRPTLSRVLRGGRPLQTAALWAWEGLAAPEPGRSLVRQHLLLMSAILESQPELAAYFLPRHVSRPRIAWRLARAAMATATAGLLSLCLRAMRGKSRGT